jgi:predicted RNA-binding Zn-ribbon protein involved in translation (DUF1610 family)
MIDQRLVLDANAVAGDLEELFGIDLTAVVHRCAHCGNLGPMATLLAYVHGPGTVLRCSICREVVMRYVLSPSGARIDLRGAAELRFSGS